MSESQHINFRLLRQYILDQQDSSADQPRGQTGKRYWRSLEEYADSPVFHEFVRHEYPEHSERWDDPIERRTFLKLMGASLALAGLSGCVYQPPEKIVPYVAQSEDEVPGRSLFYATAMSLSGIATPLLARSNEGRPTKLEGNPDHPNNRIAGGTSSSATDIFSQASVLSLYDPGRSQTTLYRDETRPWSTFAGQIRTALDALRPHQGAGLRLLTETITSPTLGFQIRGLLSEFPQAKWHQYEPANHDNARAGAMMALGQPANTIYDFSKADCVLSLDADFLSALPGTLRYARDFGHRRRPSEGAKMIRLYVVETTVTTTGAMADHRWGVRPDQLEDIATSLGVQVGIQGIASNGSDKVIEARASEALARDLLGAKGRSIVIAGKEAPPLVHALAHAINNLLGNIGQTVWYTDSLEANPVDQRQSLTELINDIDAGKVELLLIMGGNPVYNTPVDLKLDANRMSKVKLRVHLSSYNDETSELCHWHVPESHYLEAWSDARTFDGTVTIVQPLIEPLYQSKSAHEFLAVFSPQYDRKPYDIIRDYWQNAAINSGATTSPQTSPAVQAAPQPTASSPAATPSSDFEMSWRKWVHDGFIGGTALPIRVISLRTEWQTQLSRAATQSSTSGTFQLVFRTDPSIYDGRFANNGWLQELPRPMTKLTWDNAALMSPNTANRLNLTNIVGKKGRDIYADIVQLTYRNQTIVAPVWITPGHPDQVITLHLGYGRRLAGPVGNGYGFDVYKLRTSDSPWFGSGAQVRKVAGQHQFAATQLHFNMEDFNYSKNDRDIIREQTVEEYLKGAQHQDHSEPPREETLYPEHDYKNQGMGYAWGMAIDLNNCIGCNACTIACQSENNIPVVGKIEVARSREMHWIRVDTYHRGDNANSPDATRFMPVPCMHCENAPCEPVCPVHATVHSAEGLNDMVYNRCVGTKYCSNNCPYKVRRFNFFLYQDWNTPTYQLMRNPEVSVRSRGVMEKCTYCVQRIQAAKIASEVEGRKVRDGEIVTACQAVCPTDVIVFGDVNDPNSRVSKLKAEQRNYSLLGELNTRPRTTYLALLRNRNPEIGQ